MGLDQYAFTVDVDSKDDEKTELYYWRKHNRLQGWMKALWITKGNSGEFNCVDVEIDAGDLDALEEAVRGRTLPPASGFFFGMDSYGESGSRESEDL